MLEIYQMPFLAFFDSKKLSRRKFNQIELLSTQYIPHPVSLWKSFLNFLFFWHFFVKNSNEAWIKFQKLHHIILLIHQCDNLNNSFLIFIFLHIYKWAVKWQSFLSIQNFFPTKILSKNKLFLNRCTNFYLISIIYAYVRHNPENKQITLMLSGNKIKSCLFIRYTFSLSTCDILLISNYVVWLCQ